MGKLEKACPFRFYILSPFGGFAAGVLDDGPVVDEPDDPDEVPVLAALLTNPLLQAASHSA